MLMYVMHVPREKLRGACVVQSAADHVLCAVYQVPVAYHLITRGLHPSSLHLFHLASSHLPPLNLLVLRVCAFPPFSLISVRL